MKPWIVIQVNLLFQFVLITQQMHGAESIILYQDLTRVGPLFFCRDRMPIGFLFSRKRLSPFSFLNSLFFFLNLFFPPRPKFGLFTPKWCASVTPVLYKITAGWALVLSDPNSLYLPQFTSIKDRPKHPPGVEVPSSKLRASLNNILVSWPPQHSCRHFPLSLQRSWHQGCDPCASW